MISRVPSACCEIDSERMTSSVTTPPALRSRCTSPRLSRNAPCPSIRASMHISSAIFRVGIGPMPTGWYSAAARFLASSSSIAVTLHSSALLPRMATARDYRRSCDAPRWPSEFEGVLGPPGLDRRACSRGADRPGLVPGKPNVALVRRAGFRGRSGQHLGCPDPDRRAGRVQRAPPGRPCRRRVPSPTASPSASVSASPRHRSAGAPSPTPIRATGRSCGRGRSGCSSRRIRGCRSRAAAAAAAAAAPTTDAPPTTAPAEPPPAPAPPPPSYDAQGKLICPDSAITVTATTAAPTFAAGSQPIVGMVVTNTGTETCQRDVSGTLQVVHRPRRRRQPGLVDGGLLPRRGHRGSGADAGPDAEVHDQVVGYDVAPGCARGSVAGPGRRLHGGRAAGRAVQPAGGVRDHRLRRGAFSGPAAGPRIRVNQPALRAHDCYSAAP